MARKSPGKMKITIETEVKTSPAIIRGAWVTHRAITSWYFTGDGWCCPRVEINLEAGGKLRYRYVFRLCCDKVLDDFNPALSIGMFLLLISPLVVFGLQS